MASTLRVTQEDRDTAPPPAGPRVAGAPAGVTLTDGLLLLMALIWGVNFIVVKFGTRVLAPLAFNSARITLGVVVLWAVVLLRGQRLPARRDVWRLLVLGVLGNGFYQILFVEGLARARASDAALVLAATPAFVEIIGWMRGMERTGWRGMLGIALSLGGIALVVSGGTGSSAGDTTIAGAALVVAACLCWSLYSVLLKPYTDRVDGISLSAVTMTGGLVPMLIAAAPALGRTEWRAMGAPAWGAVAYSGLAALVLAYLFWYRGVKHLGPTRASMYANLQPLVAMGVAWLALGEVPRAMQLAGGACIMSGLLLTRLPASSTPITGE